MDKYFTCQSFVVVKLNIGPIFLVHVSRADMPLKLGRICLQAFNSKESKTHHVRLRYLSYTTQRSRKHPNQTQQNATPSNQSQALSILQCQKPQILIPTRFTRSSKTKMALSLATIKIHKFQPHLIPAFQSPFSPEMSSSTNLTTPPCGYSYLAKHSIIPSPTPNYL